MRKPLISKSFVLASLVAGSMLAAIAAPTNAFAAAPKTIRDELSGDAREAWDRALELFQRQRWDAAEAEFQHTYDLSKNPRVLFNVGACEKARGRYTRAIEVFKRELQEGSGKIPTDDETRLRDNISGLSDFVSTLSVDVSEPDATIVIDDETVGKSPLGKPLDVNIGQRKVQATKAGFTTVTENVTVSGKTPAHITLKIEPLVHMAVVEVIVQGAPSAIVKIDGREVGTAPYKGRVTVTNEAHVISAEAPGYVAVSQPLMVKEGDTNSLTLALSKNIAEGKLKIHALPAGSVIEIDGKPMGADVWEGPVSTESSHQITVKKAGFYTWTHDVDVRPGQEKPVSVELNEDRHPSFVPWLVGTILVVGGGAVIAGFIFTPKDQAPIKGTLSPFTVQTPASFRF